MARSCLHPRRARRVLAAVEQPHAVDAPRAAEDKRLRLVLAEEGDERVHRAREREARRPVHRRLELVDEARDEGEPAARDALRPQRVRARVTREPARPRLAVQLGAPRVEVDRALQLADDLAYRVVGVKLRARAGRAEARAQNRERATRPGGRR